MVKTNNNNGKGNHKNGMGRIEGLDDRHGK
jgi:hypothetical protein